LRLQVTNPGVLHDSSSKDRRREGLTSTGLGLDNAANRLRLLFGEKATLKLRAGDIGNVVAEAIIPLPLSHA
jgi:sensor histidine kinase YesM